MRLLPRNKIIKTLFVFLMALSCSYVLGAEYFKDNQGRTLIFHGLNTSSSAKSATGQLPWITPADVKQSANLWGFDFVRLLIFWNGVEPSAHGYDDHYLREVAKRIEWYANNHTYVMLDMHQDCYGSGTSPSDGAPPWAMVTDGQSIKPPFPSLWASCYIAPGVMAAFHHFWKNDYNLQDHYAAMWRHVAAFFNNPHNLSAEAQHYLIGYDLMNEPQNPSYIIGLVDPNFEKNTLPGFYNKVIAEVRAEDKTRWIFFEPAALWANMGFPSMLGSIKDSITPARLAYAPHLYPLGLEGTGPFLAVHKAGIKLWIKNRTAEAHRMNVPLLLGEFSINYHQKGFDEYLDTVTHDMNTINVSWTYWSNDKGDTGPVNPDGSETPIVHHLIQPYARAIAGVPEKMSFEAKTRRYQLVYQDSGSRGLSELFLPPSIYADGWNLSVDKGSTILSKSWNPVTHILSLKIAQKKLGATHSITVSAAGSD